MINKCTWQLHLDLPLFIGIECLKFRNLLDNVYLYGIYPKQQTNRKIMDILEDEYIQPIFHIFKEHIQNRTGHVVSIGGDGLTNQITYEDTGAKFCFEVRDRFLSDVDFYYNEKATNSEAINLIHIIETIYSEHPHFDIDKIADELNTKAQEWLNEIKNNTKCLETEEDGPDLKAGTIMIYDGERWQELNDVTNIVMTTNDDDVNTFYADGVPYYSHNENYVISFNVGPLSESFKELIASVGLSLSKV